MPSKIQLEELPLKLLGTGRPGITKGWGKALQEASIVCLEERGHSRSVVLVVYGSFEKQYNLSWKKGTDQMRR